MKTLDIIERIEGEARLNLEWKYKKISRAQIEFLNFRGFEYILKGKPILDSLIYTPRICGICGQAHLNATTKALENLYEKAGHKLEITNKAHCLRELGLAIEMIDSHIKWFYLFIMPDIANLSINDYSSYQSLHGIKWKKSQYITSELIKALAIFAGQWPHSSYVLPGGVMSDITVLDLISCENYIDQCISFMEKDFLNSSLENYKQFSSEDDLFKISGDLRDFIDICFEKNLHKSGKSYDRFISLSNNLGFKVGKIKNKNTSKIQYEKIEEKTEHTFSIKSKDNQNNKDKYSWAKTVQYDENFYESGPLARGLISNQKFIKSIHKAYDDSILSRVMARMNESIYLLKYCKKLLKNLDVTEASFIKPKYKIEDFGHLKASAYLEVARGSLFHEVEVQEGKIKSYNVITPTVWNLGPGNQENPGIAQKAIIGEQSVENAKLILRSFDVCSVCTTH